MDLAQDNIKYFYILEPIYHNRQKVLLLPESWKRRHIKKSQQHKLKYTKRLLNP